MRNCGWSSAYRHARLKKFRVLCVYVYNSKGDLQSQFSLSRQKNPEPIMHKLLPELQKRWFQGRTSSSISQPYTEESVQVHVHIWSLSEIQFLCSNKWITSLLPKQTLQSTQISTFITALFYREHSSFHIKIWTNIETDRERKVNPQQIS